MSRSTNQRGSRGFSLLEVIIAMAVLVIGVSAMAALSATMLTRGRQSKYMSLAGTLASEKIEDLNRWPGTFDVNGVDTSDPTVCVQGSDALEGSLDPLPPGVMNGVTSTITCNTLTKTISYFDYVSIDVINSTDCPAPTDGCFAETTETTAADGTMSYLTTYHSPDGTIPAGGASLTPVSSLSLPGSLTFRRQWVIEANPTINAVPIAGVRRITVRVTSLDPSVKSGPPFTMSVVRP